MSQDRHVDQMLDTKKTKNSRSRRGKADPELRVVEINFNPGPDAEDRLRRLFTLLVKLATQDKPPASETDSSRQDSAEVEG